MISTINKGIKQDAERAERNPHDLVDEPDDCRHQRVVFIISTADLCLWFCTADECHALCRCYSATGPGARRTKINCISCHLQSAAVSLLDYCRGRWAAGLGLDDCRWRCGLDFLFSALAAASGTVFGPDSTGPAFFAAAGFFGTAGHTAFTV